MERRLLLAVVLSFLVVTLWAALTGSCQPPRKPAPAPEEGAPGEPAPGAGEPARPAPGGPAPAEEGPEVPRPPAPEHPHDGVAEQAPGLLESEELIVGTTSRGGAIEFVRLKHSHDPGSGEPMDVVVPVDPELLMGGIDDQGPERIEAPGGAQRKEPPAGPLRRLHWVRDLAAEQATPDADVIYAFRDADGTVWRKRWVLPAGAGRFDLTLEVSRSGPEGVAPGPTRIRILAASGLLREQGTGAAFPYPNEAFYRHEGAGEASMGHLWGFDRQESELGRRLTLAGARTQYYMATWFAPEPRASAPVVAAWATGEEAARRPKMVEALTHWLRERRGIDLEDGSHGPTAARVKHGIDALHHVWLHADLPAGGAPVAFTLYVGPVSRPAVGQDRYEALAPLITYPNAPDFVADVLLAIYDLFHGLLGSAGLAVILMTLVVRGALMPLSIRNQLSMRAYGRKVARIKPKLDALKKRFGNNPKRFREEQMRLYKEHGIGFPMGCLMMLLQLPIFLALFSCLRVEYSLRGASFLWITDLAGPDRLIPFGKPVTLLLFEVASVNLLPLLLVVLSFLHQRMMPKPTDEQQAQQMRMMKWFPVIFAVILYDYTAALALYMVLSSAVAILESRIVRVRDERLVAMVKAAPGTA